MQLKTVEEIKVKGWEILKDFDPLQVHSGYSVLREAITQDRADIRAVLREGVEKKREENRDDSASYAFQHYGSAGQGGYEFALDDILTLIDTLLPGDVSDK